MSMYKNYTFYYYCVRVFHERSLVLTLAHVLKFD